MFLFPSLRTLRAELRTARLDAEHADRAAAAMRESNAQLEKQVRSLQDTLAGLERETAALRERKDASEEEHRFKRDFLDHLSHELRTPLNAVLGFSELALEEAAEPLKPLLRNALDGGRRMLRVINQMLDLARIEAGDMSLQETDAATLVAACAVGLSTTASRRGVELRTRIPEAARLRCDPQRLRQVLDVLVERALSCTPAHAAVEVSAVRKNGVIRFAVEDAGGGLDEKALTQLFQPLTGSATEQGAGLDLALCRRVVEMHGGVIQVASKPGVGATVSFTLAGIA